MINRALMNVWEKFRIRESFITTIHCSIIPEVPDLYIHIYLYISKSGLAPSASQKGPNILLEYS